jgi:hypothetical protein
MATESRCQITESRKCIFHDPQSVIRKPLLFQEIATAGQPAFHDPAGMTRSSVSSAANQNHTGVTRNDKIRNYYPNIYFVIYFL